MTTIDNSKVSPSSGKDEDPKEKGFFNRPRAGGKTIWDWMQLLLIPVILVIVGSYFSYQQAQTSLQVSQQQHQQDQQSALDQQRAAILQTYIDNIQDLLLNHNLLESKPSNDGAILARARTLIALQGLDPERKGRILIFLREAELIGFNDYNSKIHGPIIELSGVDLSGAHLNSADLSGVDLSGAHLNSADLSDALLNLADLSGAHLSGADLSHAGISSADLSGADLSHAVLNGAHLDSADFSRAYLDDTHLNDAFLNGVLFSFADLNGADLNGADLSGALLNGADLNGADLSGAHLSDAYNLTQQQLDQVSSCRGATLPQGLTCHHNQ